MSCASRAAGDDNLVDAATSCLNADLSAGVFERRLVVLGAIMSNSLTRRQTLASAAALAAASGAALEGYGEPMLLTDLR